MALMPCLVFTSAPLLLLFMQNNHVKGCLQATLTRRGKQVVLEMSTVWRFCPCNSKRIPPKMSTRGRQVVNNRQNLVNVVCERPLMQNNHVPLMSVFRAFLPFIPLFSACINVCTYYLPPNPRAIQLKGTWNFHQKITYFTKKSSACWICLTSKPNANFSMEQRFFDQHFNLFLVWCTVCRMW